MELSLPRNHKGLYWELDKLRRWRSNGWRQWVRTLIPAQVHDMQTRRHGCSWNIVIAAHFRYPGCGIGTKPADCFVYPMHDADHKEAHGDKQPPRELQWIWITETMMQGIKWDKLGTSIDGSNWIAELCAESKARRADLSTWAIEAVADQWARHFLAGDLWINKYSGM